MSLARALTKRMRSHEEVSAADLNMNRAYSTRRSDKPIDRTKISLPLELISSSNALAYEAPDIQYMQNAPMSTPPIMPQSATSSASSRKSYEDSVSSPGLSSASSVTSNEMSRESSPTTDKHKHNTTFFHFDEEPKPAPSPVKEAPAVVEPEQQATPQVPQRALSHTKQTHQVLARARSQRRSSPPPALARAPPATRSSVDMFSTKPEADHPFGAELEKVNELAEEFGMKDVQRGIQILDDESQYLIDNGFCRFSAEDYISEIQPLFASAFPAPVAWL